MRRFCGASRYRSGRAVVMLGARACVWQRGSTAGRIAALGIVVAGFGCAGGRDRSPFIAQEDARINIEVINHGFQDATLHAIWSGRRVRLGTVTGTGTANFMLPWDRSLELRIEIDLLAGGECTTRPIWADPGDIILLEVQTYLRYCGM